MQRRNGDGRAGWCWSSAAWAAWTCAGSALRYVLAAERLPYAVKISLGPRIRPLARRPDRCRPTATAKAGEIAETIRAFQAEQPGDPVFLVAKSGGAGIVVKALELLDERHVERAVLLAPALSPRLRPDRGPPRRPPGDGRLLVAAGRDHPGAGHPILRHDRSGQDRRRGAGGLSASRPSTTDDAERRRAVRKLRQVRWRPRMAATGYLGGHIGPDSPLFLRKYVVPLLAG